jgi:uncharacterized membrane protein YoaK (UPF0700 family)
MTGNTILLGLSIGQGKLATSLHSLAALAGFFAGSILGGFIIEDTKKAWSQYITLSIAIETIIIFLLVVIWLDEGDPLSNFVLYISIVLSAIAMGIQSATIRHLNIPGVVTTFLTGTLTSIGMSAVTGFRSGFKKKIKRELPGLPLPKNLEQRIELQVIIFMAYGITAVITGWMEYHNILLLALLPLTLIIIVFVIVIYHPAHPHILKNISEGKNRN